MFCSYCGKQIDDDAIFCDYCGAAIDDSTISNEKPVQPVVTSKKVSVKKEINKPLAIVLIIIIVLGILGCIAIVVGDNYRSKTYSITFEADELIKEAGVSLNGAHVGIAVLSNLTCSNGNAKVKTEKIYIYDTLIRVEVTGAKAGEVVLGGTITTYGLDTTYQGDTVSYPVEAGVFLVSKTVGLQLY